MLYTTKGGKTVSFTTGIGEILTLKKISYSGKICMVTLFPEAKPDGCVLTTRCHLTHLRKHGILIKQKFLGG